MDLTRQYITQIITVAANNLRLSSEKIETVAMLREHLTNCEDLEEEIAKFKKITELSRFGVKLGEVHNSIVRGKIDFLKISDKFKEQSHSLIMVMSNLLDIVTPNLLADLLKKLRQEPPVDVTLEEKKSEMDLTPEKVKRGIKVEVSDKKTEEPQTEKIKGEIILDDLDTDEDFSFEQFQKRILKPIKSLESFLVRLSKNEYHEDELLSFIELVKINADTSEKIGFQVISNMHVIFAVGLKLIYQKKIFPTKDVIEALRACLIVIVAVIKSKNLDITNYLNKAELFGQEILKFKEEKKK